VTEHRSGTNKLIRGALFLVMGAALTVGTWSIYTLLTTKFHAPREVAFFGAGMFDIAALYFALLAQRYATTEDSGLAPRLAMLAMVATSSWVNWTHAQMEHWGIVGGVILAAAPVIAELSFEMWHRFEHREALRRLGRVQKALPVVPGLAWLLYPQRAGHVMRASVGAQLDVVQRHAALTASGDDALHVERITDTPPRVTARAGDDAQHIVITLQQPHQQRAITAAPRPPRQPVPHDAQDVVARQDRDTAARIFTVQSAASPDAASDDTPETQHDTDFAALTKADAVRVMRDALPDASPKQIADALVSRGVSADAAYVRTVFSRDARSAPQQGTGGYL
jgi:hypothetical protein